MTAVTRGSQPAEHKAAAPAQEQGTAARGDSLALTRRASTDATASSRTAIRGRLAERMAQIAKKAGAPAPTPTAQQTASPTAQPAPPAPVPQSQAPKASRDKSKKPASSISSLSDRIRAEHLSLVKKLHARVLDAPREQLFFVPTKDAQALSTLTITSPNKDAGHDYRPVPCQVFDWAIAQIPEDLSGFTFVDYGAGKGRAMLLAAEHPFAAVAGVEFAAELHDNAQMNIAQYPRSNMRCRNVECVLEDAVQVGPPEGASVHYFFNPFGRGVFAEVLNNIVMAYRMKPRRLYLVLIDPVATDLVDASGVFARVEPSQIDDLKLRLLSPYSVAVYRSLA